MRQLLRWQHPPRLIEKNSANKRFCVTMDARTRIRKYFSPRPLLVIALFLLLLLLLFLLLLLLPFLLSLVTEPAFEVDRVLERYSGSLLEIVLSRRPASLVLLC